LTEENAQLGARGPIKFTAEDLQYHVPINEVSSNKSGTANDSTRMDYVLDCLVVSTEIQPDRRAIFV